MTASSGHGAAAKRPSKKWVIWVKRSTFLLAGAVLAGATVLALGTSPRMREAWSLINGDHGPKRWLVLKEGKPSDQSDCYRNLSDPLPSRYGEYVHSEEASIPRMPGNWNRPHVSAYSVAPTPRSLPALRDLGDRGQEEAIRFLENNAALKTKAWIDLQDALNYSATSDTAEKDPFRFDAFSWQRSLRAWIGTLATG